MSVKQFEAWIGNQGLIAWPGNWTPATIAFAMEAFTAGMKAAQGKIEQPFQLFPNTGSDYTNPDACTGCDGPEKESCLGRDCSYDLEDAQEELETERLRLAACGVAALGYFEGCDEKYDSASLQDVLRLRKRLEETEQAKDGAYYERNRVVAALAKCFPSGTAKTAIEGWSEDWHGCVYIDLPTGQASWHYHESQAYLFKELPPYKGTWDGHTTEEKYDRMLTLKAAQEGEKCVGVKGMEMPNSCWTCRIDCQPDEPFADVVGRAIDFSKERHPDCPLVQAYVIKGVVGCIPEPKEDSK